MNRVFKSFRNATIRFWSGQKDYWNHIYLLFRNEHYPTLLSRDIKERYRMLTNLKLIDQERKNEINSHMVMNYSRELARLNFDEERLHALLKIFYRITMFVYILFIGKVFQIAGISPPHGMLGSTYPSTFGGHIRAFGPVIAFLLLYSLFVYLVAKRISFSKLLIMYVMFLSLSLSYLSFPFSQYEAYALGLAGFHIIILTAIGLNILITKRYERFVVNKTPESIIVYNLLLVLHRLDDGSLNNYYSKRMFVTRLEYAALFMEKYIYKVLKTSDDEANQWIMEMTRQIAAAIRDKKKWVYTPKPDTAQHLAERLADFLIHFLRNEWDSLDRVEVPKLSQKTSGITQFLTTARSLIFGLLPISILCCFRKQI
jgi:hypothetical protein